MTVTFAKSRLLLVIFLGAFSSLFSDFWCRIFNSLYWWVTHQYWLFDCVAARVSATFIISHSAGQARPWLESSVYSYRIWETNDFSCPVSHACATTQPCFASLIFHWACRPFVSYFIMYFVSLKTYSPNERRASPDYRNFGAPWAWTSNSA